MHLFTKLALSGLGAIALLIMAFLPPAPAYAVAIDVTPNHARLIQPRLQGCDGATIANRGPSGRLENENC
jgi:hypothetical protein